MAFPLKLCKKRDAVGSGGNGLFRPAPGKSGSAFQSAPENAVPANADFGMAVHGARPNMIRTPSSCLPTARSRRIGD